MFLKSKIVVQFQMCTKREENSCKVCNIVLNHERKSTIANHLKKMFKERGWVATNISLSETDQPLVQQFLDTRVKNGGAISGGYQQHEAYLTDASFNAEDCVVLLMRCASRQLN
uniref:BED-type domain-containing protein n=1 Tax=Callorhinchus milii TaxID=7868 RepID=A0A4W3J573_CALMI